MNITIPRWLSVFVLIGATLPFLAAQSGSSTTDAGPVSQERELRSTYVLGADDQIVIRALDAEEINDKPVRIDMSGNIRLPMIGRVHAAGLTIEQLENTLTERLQPYIKEPQVAVSINEFRSQPISIIGAVTTPGTHQLQGKKTLIEMLSLAGGVKDEAGPVVKITRQMRWGPIPLPNAVVDPSGQVSVAQVNLKDILEAKNPLENILIRPEDVITVPRAQSVYLMGEVQKPGVYVLRERQSVSVLMALSMAGGMSHSAGGKKAKILRVVAANQERSEIPINLNKILAGTDNDVPLLPDDILFVPNNVSKNVAVRTLEAMVTVGTGMAVYRF